MADVNVVNRNNQVVAIEQSDLQDAIKQGYRVATPEETKSALEKSEFTSGVNPLLAGVAGAGRALTFGGSDIALAKTGLVNPETLKKLEEYNPVESVAGEVAGIGASLLVPGYGEATAARGATQAALRAATAPVRGVSAASRALGAMVKEALPAASTALGRAGVAGAEMAVAGAAEGSLFGLGRAATEYAMGDPSLNGESILSHVGLSALLGGGIGGALGFAGSGIESAASGLRKLMPEKPLPESGPTIINTPKGKEVAITAPNGTLERSMQEAGYDSAKIQEVLDNSRNLKTNAAEIIEDSRIAGLSPMEGQISSRKSVQHAQTMLLDRPGSAGEAQRQVFETNWAKAGSNYDAALNTGETRSAHELGKVQKEFLKDQVDAVYKPIQERFKSLGPDAENILVPERRLMDLMGDLLENAERPTAGAAVGGPRKKLFEQWAERIQDQKTLGNMDGIFTELGNAERSAWRSGSYTEANVLGDIKNTVRNFQDDVIDEAHLAFAKKSGMADAEAAALAKSLKDDRRMTKKAYANFIELIGDLSGVVKLGKNRTYREVMMALEKIEPSKLAENAFRGDRINALTKLQKDFPAAFDLFSVQQKKEILESVMRDGVVDPRLAAKKIFDPKSGLPKEIREMLFSKEELAVMKGTKTWLEALPQDWAPSKTPRGMMYMDYFSSPTKAAASEVMGHLQAAYIKSSVQETSMLIQLQKSANRSLNKIKSGAKAVFDTTSKVYDKGSGYAAEKIADSLISHEKPEKVIENIREVANNPQLFIDKMSQGTEMFQKIAPETAQAMQVSAAQAVQYLNMVAPQTKSAYPLGDNPKPSKADLHIFSERLNLVKNPTSILKELKFGTLTPEHVEMVSSIYPKMYASMQQAVMEQLTDHVAKKKPINYKTKNMLSLFLNQDLDESITAQSVLANQIAMRKSYIEDQQADNAMRSPQKGLDELSNSTEMMTDMQKSAVRDEA